MYIRKLVFLVLLCFTAITAFGQDQKARAQSLVKEAVALGKSQGKPALLKEVNPASGRFHAREGNELYIFVYDMQGVCQGIGYQGNHIGINRFGLKDPDGKFFLQEMIQVAKTKGSGWVDYKYPNPKNNKIEQKTSYVEYLDGWVIGCGIYK